MNLIAIDTATEKFSVALAVEQLNCVDTWLFEADVGMRHSELVMDGIDALVQKAALAPSDIDGVVCMGGPGSFTGLRIGFSLAKGFALSLGIPFAPIPTLDCLAWPFSSWPGIAVPVLDAKKRAFFCALYHEGRRLNSDMDATPSEIAFALASNFSSHVRVREWEREQALLFGPGAEKLFGELMLLFEDNPSFADIQLIIRYGKGIRWGNAETLLEIARTTGIFTVDGDESNSNLFAGPEYIRKSDAEINLGNQNLPHI